MKSYFLVNNNYSFPITITIIFRRKVKKFPTERLALMTQNKFNFMKNFNYLWGMKLNADTEDICCKFLLPSESEFLLLWKFLWLKVKLLHELNECLLEWMELCNFQIGICCFSDYIYLNLLYILLYDVSTLSTILEMRFYDDE